MKLRNLLLAASVVVLGACESDSTGPAAQIEGTYTLSTLDGQTLPAIFVEIDADNRIEILSGVIVLNSNGTFTDQTDVRLTIDGEVTTEDEDASGTYTVSGNTITFTTTEGGTYSAVINTAAGTITQNVEGRVLVYTR
jgi:hypothetical protein